MIANSIMMALPGYIALRYRLILCLSVFGLFIAESLLGAEAGKAIFEIPSP